MAEGQEVANQAVPAAAMKSGTSRKGKGRYPPGSTSYTYSAGYYQSPDSLGTNPSAHANEAQALAEAPCPGEPVTHQRLE